LVLTMGMASNTTPPWVDEETIDKEKKRKIDIENIKKIQDLQKENESLKEEIKELKKELEKTKK